MRPYGSPGQSENWVPILFLGLLDRPKDSKADRQIGSLEIRFSHPVPERKESPRWFHGTPIGWGPGERDI